MPIVTKSYYSRVSYFRKSTESREVMLLVKCYQMLQDRLANNAFIRKKRTQLATIPYLYANELIYFAATNRRID